MQMDRNHSRSRRIDVRLPNAEEFRRLVSGQCNGPAAMLARAGLAAVALPYRLGVAGRNWAYSHRWARVYRVERPVISIGNITLGGTGKTPMVEWAARWLRARDARVVLVSRGYKAGEGMNDEGLVLDQNLPDVPHLQDRDRVRLARIAIDELDAQVILLDDGFQHRRLARDLDIVLLDALCPFGYGRMFPRGFLREPVGSLRRARVVVLSRADLVEREVREDIRARADRAAGPLRWAEVVQVPRDVIDFQANSAAVETLGGQRVGAFCGIGNPEGFRRTLTSRGIDVCAFRAYPDHHAYNRVDVDDLGAWLLESGAELALTTQKDLVKLRVATLAGVPLRALRIGLEFLNGEDEVAAALAEAVQRG